MALLADAPPSTAQEIGQVQRIFCEVHALTAPEPAAAAISELLAAGVAPARVLALYPFVPQEFTSNLQAHLRDAHGYDSFMWAASRLGGSMRYRNLREQLTFAHRLARNTDWFIFFAEWTGLESSHAGWQSRSGDRLTLNDAFDIMWLGAHWPELREVHVAAGDAEWALSELRAALTFPKVKVELTEG